MEAKRAKKTNGPGKTAKAVEGPEFDVKAFLSSVGSGRSTGKYKGKKVIFQQGDPADSVYFIQSGKIELSVLSQQGKEKNHRAAERGRLLRRGMPGGSALAHGLGHRARGIGDLQN